MSARLVGAASPARAEGVDLQRFGDHELVEQPARHFVHAIDEGRERLGRAACSCDRRVLAVVRHGTGGQHMKRSQISDERHGIHQRRIRGRDGRRNIDGTKKDVRKRDRRTRREHAVDPQSGNGPGQPLRGRRVIAQHLVRQESQCQDDDDGHNRARR